MSSLGITHLRNMSLGCLFSTDLSMSSFSKTFRILQNNNDVLIVKQQVFKHHEFNNNKYYIHIFLKHNTLAAYLIIILCMYFMKPLFWSKCPDNNINSFNCHQKADWGRKSFIRLVLSTATRRQIEGENRL